MLRYLFIGLMLYLPWSSTYAHTVYRNFWHPLLNGQRLDYCFYGHKACGSAVANGYCQSMGYEKAIKSIIDYNIGLTHYLNTRLQCNGWTCDGFKLIRCQSNAKHPPKSYAYRTRLYVFPRLNRYRVDWCYMNNKQCGKKAAHSFCRRMGYMKAEDYKIQAHVPATRALGNQKLCFGKTCNAFSYITCFR